MQRCGMPRQPATVSPASTGPRPRGRGMRMAGRGQRSGQAASTGPRPRGRGMLARGPAGALRYALQRGRARAGAEWQLAAGLARRRMRFNGAAPARARNVLSRNSFQRKLATTDLRLPASISFPFFSCCGSVSHYSFNIKRLRHASTSGVFRVTSPLAGSIIKEHQSLTPHNTARPVSHRAVPTP